MQDITVVTWWGGLGEASFHFLPSTCYYRFVGLAPVLFLFLLSFHTAHIFLPTICHPAFLPNRKDPFVINLKINVKQPGVKKINSQIVFTDDLSWSLSHCINKGITKLPLHPEMSKMHMWMFISFPLQRFISLLV